MTFPTDPDGYSVNLDTGTVHTRYAADHAGNSYRTRTVRGVENLLDGREPKICRTCYPSAATTTPRSTPTPQRRRNAAPVPRPTE